MNSKRFALTILFAVLITVSSIGALNYLFSEQNRLKNNGNEDLKTTYDLYHGVDLFKKGIHIIGTSYDPITLKENYSSENSYWQKLKENRVTLASSNDFISLIISRGDLPTGGYAIQVKSFSLLESYPVKFRFHVDFTDPSDDIIVTQALTNPLVFAPIGKIDPGEYIIEVHVTQYIMNFDEQGKTVYTPVPTFKEEVWIQTFIVQSN